MIIATHDPLLVSGLKKEQIILFSFVGPERKIKIFTPKLDPIGYGIEGILTGEFFGMHSTLDKYTLDRMDEKRRLMIKAELNPEEIILLESIDRFLNESGLNFTFRDPIYNIFLRSLRDYEEKNKIILTDFDREQQRELADDLIKEIQEK